MDRPTATDVLRQIMSYEHTVHDLASCFGDHIHTTKHDRREKAVAYLLDEFTGWARSNMARSQRTFVLVKQVLLLTDELKRLSPSVEVKTACDRVEQRLAWMLNHPSTYQCNGCGEAISFDDTDHHCDPKKTGPRDRAMSHDDTIGEVS